MAKIMIVDDHISFRTVLAETLVSLKHDVVEAGTGGEALQLLAAESESIELVFLDLRMPDQSGLDVLREIRKNTAMQNLPIVILTAYADSTNTIEAMKLGAFDHVTKPISREDVKRVIARSLTNYAPITAKEQADVGRTKELIGESSAFREVEKLIGLSLTTSCPVLLIGEAGTGKEKIARTIHAHSDENLPFLSVSCSSPDQGFAQWTEQGTIYLKELADLDAKAQTQLIGILSKSNLTPRVVSGTSQDLENLMNKGAFREDLYYRLSGFVIRVPPLRKRNSDVLIIAEEYLNSDYPNTSKRLTPAASKALLEYSWPGNVRELLNTIKQAAVVSRGNIIDFELLSFAHPLPLTEFTLSDLLHMDYYAAIGRLEKMLLEKALKDAAGNRTEAARTLGINRQLLYAKLKEHSIE